MIYETLLHRVPINNQITSFDSTLNKAVNIRAPLQIHELPPEEVRSVQSVERNSQQLIDKFSDNQFKHGSSRKEITNLDTMAAINMPMQTSSGVSDFRSDQSRGAPRQMSAKPPSAPSTMANTRLVNIQSLSEIERQRPPSTVGQSKQAIHPNVISIQNSKEAPQGTDYYVYKLECQNLSKLLEREQSQAKQITAEADRLRATIE